MRNSNRLFFLPLCWIRDTVGRGEVTPRRLRIYANRANIIDFSEAEDVQPSLNISLLEGETSVTEYPLLHGRLLKYQQSFLVFGT